MTEAQKKELERALWAIANDLRGKMDADEFRDYILGFIFYKYLSERISLYADGILEADGITFGEIEEGTPEGDEVLEAVRSEAIDELGYFLKPSELFAAIAERGGRKGNNFILDDLTRILENIQKSTMGSPSEEDFNHLFEDMDLGSTKLGRSVGDRNDLVAKVLTHLNRLDFHLHDVDSDLLGDAYEYLIGKFASGAGKKAGEFYTPQQVSTILARLVTTGKTRLQSVYDPTCGSGSLLLRVAREVGLRNVGGFYGQELNRTTYNLARMNMILHGVHYRKFNLKQEDTLERPQHDGKFEAVVANPPFSANWKGIENPSHSDDDRFSAYGGLAPSSKADFAFVLHMIHHLADNGTMAVILPHGALFRGGAEGRIRKILIAERNYLDAVIGLPVNVFYGTSIPTCILVFKKCREHPQDILFIDASAHFEKAKNQNILGAIDIAKIVNIYRARTSEDRYSHVSSLTEIAENGYNLNIPRYVDALKPEAAVDLKEVLQSLSIVQGHVSKLDERIEDACNELGADAPSGNNSHLLQMYKIGLMQRIFSQKIRFLKDDGEAFPDWQSRKLGEVFAERSERGNENATLLSVTLRRGVVNADEVERVNEASADRSNYKTVHPGDIAYNSMRMWQGASGMASVHGIVSPAYTVLTPRTEQSSQFWAQVFKRRDVINIFQRFSQGLTSDTWNLKYPALADITMTVPHISEQLKIAYILSLLDDRIAAISAPPSQFQTSSRSLQIV